MSSPLLGLALACPLTIEPIAQQAYLKASNNGAEDRFGYSVAVSDDVLVIGAPFEDSAATGVNGDGGNDDAIESGAAYVFRRLGSSWIQEAYLKPSNTDPGDGFGHAVAVSGDTIVVGAVNEDSAATGIDGNQASNASGESGAAYVFRRIGSAWSQEAYLKASNTGAGDAFGHSVAVDGDTIVIGAWREDSSATGINGNQANNDAGNSGAAYVFVRDVTWTQQAYVKASNTGGFVFPVSSGDAFGYSVALSGDILLVGAPFEGSSATGVNGNQNDNSRINAGAAYAFVRTGSSWSQEAYLKSSNTGMSNNFGRSVSVAGQTAVVGEPFENSSSPASGAAHVFTRDGTGWSAQASLKASNPNTNDFFGISVSVSGERLVIGAMQEDSNASGVNGNQSDNSAPGAGAAYLFEPAGSSWGQAAYLKASNTGPGDGLGLAVAVFEEVIVLGAPFEDSGATGVGGNQGDESSLDAGAAYQLQVCDAASVATRTGGSNPVSYSAAPILIGGMFSATVDNGLASQLTSALFAFDSPFVFTLGGGQTLLALDLGGSGELFTGAGLFPSSSAAGVDTFSLPFASDPANCGVVYYTQAIQFGNPPFVLSNSQDITIGSF